ncbi:uncharacterized protein JN550_009292 [Neoarthrinium moseri]|uniref:uncharacterized protein n=1 Tax=Neoarthrinium moseri TaxID=1658444 RepID=UPI001FDCB1EF|nr:uncharacterized protein JN550_009292 [Neoarthrinium moseri]KAI1863794.1 hypothetical protein JN550_009292 [Neoarthrinium moseri]
MRPARDALPGPRAFSWRTTLLVAVLLWQVLMATTVEAKKDKPTITVTDFDRFPVNLNYFPDSDIVLFQDQSAGTIYRSADAGATWKKVDQIPDGKAAALVMHEYDQNRAYVLTKGMHHWRTHNRGETWETFFTDAELNIFRNDWMVFHATNPDHILFYGIDCESIFCDEVVMYTKDGFESEAEFLRGMTDSCWWAKSSPLFATGDDELDNNRVLCIVKGNFSPLKEDNRLLISDNFFSAKGADGVVQEFEPNLNGIGPVQGVVNLAVVKKYMLIATASKNTDEMALYVTDDTLKWHRAVFPSDHRINEAAYTVLEGTNYSIQIDVMNARPSNPMGVMLTSNSNGTYFTKNVEHTNRNMMGHVDFEKITGVQGIFLINQVDNWEDVQQDSKAKKKLKTKITFDDGRTFEKVHSDDKTIHLHSVTELNNVGRVFSSPAPGLVMGNGNTGDYLEAYDDANLYVSDDAGRTWAKGPDGPHKFEFGDQGSILLAVRDVKSPEVTELKYSLNHGKSWDPLELPDSLKVRPWVLTTTQDSTSLKFILTAESKSKYHVISIDFDGLHEATCKESDMEDWIARVDDKNKASCLMGHTQTYHRRKKEAKCFVNQVFKDPVPISVPCDCSADDFECDFNFVKKDGKCEKVGPVIPPEGACKKGDPEETFMGSSGWRLIPGDDCKRTGKDSEQKDALKEWKCKDAASAPGGGEASGKISHKQNPIKGDFSLFEKHYLERGDTNLGDDETIIMRPYTLSPYRQGDIMVSQDHGKSWDTPKTLADADILYMNSHQYSKDRVFFITKKGKIIYSIDRGQNFFSFTAPDPPNLERLGSPWSFHPDRKDWLIWHGKRCSDGGACYDVASVSRDRGDNWETLARFVARCEFTGSQAYKGYGRPEKQVTCLRKAREDDKQDNPYELVYTDDFIEDKGNMKLVHTNVKDFATMAEFIVVATENQTAQTLHAWASVDGQKYAAAHWPHKFEVGKETLYTVLDSSTHAVNLFVEVDNMRGYGSILKSNSNGTSYVLSVPNVNVDKQGYVDFERMLGIQGVAVVNSVENPNSDSEPKKLQTRITHNDGAEWAFLPTPKKDGKNDFGCYSTQGDENCALHIHGYTERVDRGKTYSSESAVGIMFGWGNVGAILGDIKDADTFMTTDAGLSWKLAQKGKWTWSFGDQGSIIILAQRESKTKSIKYTVDEGESWQDYTFSDSDVVITDITTLRSGASRNFLLWGHEGDKLFTINIDFTGLTNQECKFDKDDLSKSDYNLWTPRHPKQPDGCLFGHQAQYLRKKTDRKCFNAQKLQHLWGFDNCTCTRQDYECDFNYEMDEHGQCKLVEGYQPVSLEQYCKENPDAIEFYEPSGYRRIPLTTCSGGDKEMDKMLTVHPCPGKEEEFERAHGVSGVAIFFAIIIPIGIAGAIGWWVWRNWTGKFGQIRLGDQGSTFDSDSPLVKYPVVAVSAVVAVVATLPLVASSIWRAGSSLFERFTGRGGAEYSWLGGSGPRRFTTRDSFARGRADYAIVDEDEGELLGEDSDEEV